MMTIKDLVDVIDYNRSNDANIIKIMDCNGKAQLTTHTACPLLDEIEDKVIDSIRAEDADTFAIWLKDGEKTDGN